MASYRSWGLRSAGLGLAIVAAATACGGDDDDSTGGGARAGKGGKAGSGGGVQAGNGGRQNVGGSAGSSNVAGGGSGGTAGNASGGVPAAGGAGTAGVGGTSGAGTSGTGTGGQSAAGNGSGGAGIGGTDNVGGASGQGGEGGEAGNAAGASGGGGGPPECTMLSECNDDDACSTDSCDSGGDCQHVAVVLDDSDPCTTDACAASTGVSHTPKSGGACVLTGGGTGVCSTGACVPTVCGNNAVEPGEECDGGNITDLDGCNSKCQSEVSSGPGLGLAITDNGYNGMLTSMVCVDLGVGTKGDGLVDSVKVLVGLSHTWVGDLVLKLVSPTNTVVTLMSRPGLVEPADDGMSSGGDNTNLALGFPLTFLDGGAKSAEAMGSTITNTQVVCQDDAACAYAPAAGSATAGTFSAFTGQAAIGTWRFCAGDALTGDTGSIDFVRVSIVQ